MLLFTQNFYKFLKYFSLFVIFIEYTSIILKLINNNESYTDAPKNERKKVSFAAVFPNFIWREVYNAYKDSFINTAKMTEKNNCVINQQWYAQNPIHLCLKSPDTKPDIRYPRRIQTPRKAFQNVLANIEIKVNEVADKAEK